MGKRLTSLMVIVAAMLFALPVSAQINFAKKAKPGPKQLYSVNQAVRAAKAQLAKDKLLQLKAADQPTSLLKMVENDRAEKAQFVQEMTERIKPETEALPLFGNRMSSKAIAMNAKGVSQRNPLMVLTAPVSGIKKAGAEYNEHGIMIAPPEGTHTLYTRSGTGYYASGQSVYIGEQSGTVEIVECEDGKVYIKDIISHYSTGAWVDGVKDGTTITVATRQPLNWSDTYTTTLSLRWMEINAEGSMLAADDHADSFTFTIDGDVISLEGTAAWDSNDVFMMAVMWDDDDSSTGYADAETVWTSIGEYDLPIVIDELVTLPEGVTPEEWYFAGLNAYTNSKVGGNANVAFDGEDVYVQGLFEEFPDAWIKGSVEDDKVTFTGFQFIGVFVDGEDEYNIYAVGAENSLLYDFTMTYDKEAKVLTADKSLLANASTSEVYFLEYYNDLVIQAEPFPEESAVTGDPIDVLPYTNDFANDNAFAEFGIIDVNEDGKTWTLNTSGYAQYTYNTNNPGDDWLISPAIKLEAGKLYHFAIDAASYSTNYPETFEVKMGVEPKVSALKTEVIPSTTVSSTTFSTFENETLAVEETGYYHIAIHAISAANMWNLLVDNFLIEQAAAATAPDAVTNFTVVPFDDGTIGATITFDAPTVNIDGSEITENLTKIEVLRDGKVIGTIEDVQPGAECNLVDDAADLTIGDHKYQVLPYNAEGPGKKSEEITVHLSGIMSLPYFVDFSTDGAFDTYTVIDANEDGSTWSLNSGAASYLYSNSNAGDDYLVSAAFRMEAGKTYHMNLNARCNGYEERIEVLLGKEPTVDGLTTTILKPTDVVNTEAQDYGFDFTVDEDGVYYFAVHAISDPDQFRLYINTISIDVLSPTAPVAIDDLNVEPGAQGALNATLTFTAPAKSLDGNDLEGNLKLVILRDGEQIEQLEDVLPGSVVSYIDENFENAGTYSYQVYAVNAAGEPSMKCDAVSVYVGNDIPMAVDALSFQDQVGKVLFDWDEVGEEGQNGGYVDPAGVNYSIWSVEIVDYGFFQDYEFSEQLGEVTGSDNVTVDLDMSEGTEQDIRYFGIKTANDVTPEGGVEGKIIPLCFGPAYEIPFEEHVTDGNVSYLWLVDSSDGNVGAYLYNESSDGDGHGLALVSEDEDGGYVALATGKIALNGATNPVLMFDYQKTGASDFAVVISQPNEDGTMLDQVFPAGEGWQNGLVELKDYASADYIQIMFLGNFDGEGIVALDNFLVFDQLEDNLIVDLNAPSSVVAGKAAPITISLKNMGANVAEDYTLKLTAGDEEIEINEPVEAINPMQTATFTAEFAPTVFAEAGEVTLKVEAVYDYDLDEDDNVAETVITVKEPTYAAPESLTATAEGTKANLEWTVAEGGTVEDVTEDFEDTEVFPAWSTGGITADSQTGAFGDWTLFDGNNMTVYSFDGWSFPNNQAVSAWMVASSEQAEIASNWPPTSGSQLLWSFCPIDYDSGSAPAADHWLISPELPGIAQTISFQQTIITDQYGPETFEVLASDSDNDPGSFSLVESFSKNNTEWETVSADLPEGTKYFAIRHTSTDVFGLLIDDVQYAAGGSSDATGFNIYVDEVLVGSVEGGVLTYVTGELPVGEHKVSVTALYGNNESKPVDAFVVIEVPTAIEDIINAEGLMNIYNLNGVKMQGDKKQLQKGAYIINNKKVVVK